jgi:hypothetical protein
MKGNNTEQESAVQVNNNTITINGNKLNDLSKKYLFLEAEQRRSEINYLIKKTDNDQKYALIGMGIYWSWFLSKDITSINKYKLLIVGLPIVVIVFYIIRYANLHRSIKKVAKYLKIIETCFLNDNHIGWENYISNIKNRKGVKDYMHISANLFWILVLLVNIIIGIIYFII